MANAPPAAFFAHHAVPPFLIGLVLLAHGSALFFGHREIEVRDGKLTATERVGPPHWSWWRSLEKIRCLTVHSQAYETDPRNAPDRLTMIRLYAEGARTLWVAPGYPQQWLRALADQLARQCTAWRPETLEHFHRVEIDEAFSDPISTAFPDRPAQPARSNIVVERGGGEMTLRIPPPDLGTGGGLLLLGIIEAFMFAGIVTALIAAPGRQGAPIVLFVLFVSLFGLPA
jgi:hypothetical protein